MESAEIWYKLGKTCSEIGMLEKAAEAFEKAIEQQMQSGLLYNELAEIYLLQGNFTGALPLYQKSLELFSSPKELSQVWGRIGNACTRLNEYGKAIQAFQKAAEFQPKPSREEGAVEDQPNSKVEDLVFPLQDEQAADLEDETDTEETDEQNAQPAVNEDDGAVQESANVWNELGLVLFKVGAYEDAIDSYQKAISINPAIGYLYSNLGQVYTIQGKLVEAVQQYEKSLQLLVSNKDKSVSWTRLGDIYKQLGKPGHAEPAYLLAEVLIQTTAVFNNEYRQVKLETINTNADPVRGMAEIGDLVQSVRVFGIIQPLLVCPGRNDPGKFTLISGRRRLEAARLAGLKEVPVIVRLATNQEILELSLSENIHHHAVTPFELASAYVKMTNDFELSIEEISGRTGRSSHSVANTMKMLEPPQPIKPISNDTIRENGQKIIDRSLAALQAKKQDGSVDNPTQVLPLLSGKPESLVVGSGSEKIAVEAPVPVLWYLEPRKMVESSTAKQEKAKPEGVSLLSRARRVLKSNP